jgi:hypothetical protein
VLTNANQALRIAHCHKGMQRLNLTTLCHLRDRGEQSKLVRGYVIVVTVSRYPKAEALPTATRACSVPTTLTTLGHLQDKDRIQESSLNQCANIQQQ